MFSYIISKAIYFLENQGVILYPTDTIWGIGCDATNQKAVEKIYQIKKRSETKSLILLVSDFQMLQKYVQLPTDFSSFLNQQKKPTSVIYENPIGLAINTIASDNTIAIRIAEDDFCKQLISEFGKPIVSTSANISGEPSPSCFAEISPKIKNSVDYVVPYRQDDFQKKTSSQLVRLEKNGEVKILRP